MAFRFAPAQEFLSFREAPLYIFSTSGAMATWAANASGNKHDCASSTRCALCHKWLSWRLALSKMPFVHQVQNDRCFPKTERLQQNRRIRMFGGTMQRGKH